MKTSDELEFRDLVMLFLKRSWVIAIAVGVALGIGYRHARSLPDLYTSTALLVPASSASPHAAPGGELGSSSSSSKSPELSLYQALMTSRTVMKDILVRQIQRSNELSFQSVASILGVDTANSVAMQMAAANLSRAVTLDDQGDGIIKVSFTSTDQNIAPQMTDLVLEVTQRELNRVRTDRLETILGQLQKSVNETFLKYSQASNAVAGFSNANASMESGTLQARRAELESNLKVCQADYQEARQQADQMRLELDQLYPPAVVFDPASRPALKIGPNRTNIVMVAGIVGLLIGIVMVLAWEFLLRKKPA
jgi:uncharacterized protein involved in exopolysaccharide biosynthesis